MNVQTPYLPRWGQKPLTRILPMGHAARVDLLSGPDKRFLREVVPEFVAACHQRDPTFWRFAEGTSKTLDDVVEGKTLWQAGEIIHFTFRLSGVSRILTHQLVRARVGITFSQQCTGEQDCRHWDVIRPDCFLDDDDSRADFEEQCLSAKVKYARILDRRRVSCRQARYLLPEGLATNIQMHICLGSLVGLYMKRADVMSQSFEIYTLMMVMREELKQTYPWLVRALPDPYDVFLKGYWNKTHKTPYANTNLYPPPVEWTSDFNREDFVYPDFNCFEGPGCTLYGDALQREVKHYLGDEYVTRETWQDWFKAYHEGFLPCR